MCWSRFWNTGSLTGTVSDGVNMNVLFPYSSRTQLYNTKGLYEMRCECDDEYAMIVVLCTSVRGRMSGSACILAMTSHRMIPNANTSTCRERNTGRSKTDGHTSSGREIKLKTGIGNYHFYCSGDFLTKLHSSIVNLCLDKTLKYSGKFFMFSS